MTEQVYLNSLFNSAEFKDLLQDVEVPTMEQAKQAQA